ncbi:hypothetical protein FJTKL_13038 [Diaporthe vaccinii]|uniref:Uncharacterized protein n=1 Tax=Diaporthe vaccinii TaxID=105482 RepID=A0ABR4EBV4_9PEZI
MVQLPKERLIWLSLPSSVYAQNTRQLHYTRTEKNAIEGAHHQFDPVNRKQILQSGSAGGLINELLLPHRSLENLTPRLIILIQVSVASSGFHHLENNLGDFFRHTHERIVAPAAPEHPDVNALAPQPRNAHLLELGQHGGVPLADQIARRDHPEGRLAGCTVDGGELGIHLVGHQHAHRLLGLLIRQVVEEVVLRVVHLQRAVGLGMEHRREDAAEHARHGLSFVRGARGHVEDIHDPALHCVTLDWEGKVAQGSGRHGPSIRMSDDGEPGALGDLGRRDVPDELDVVCKGLVGGHHVVVCWEGGADNPDPSRLEAVDQFAIVTRDVPGARDQEHGLLCALAIHFLSQQNRENMGR